MCVTHEIYKLSSRTIAPAPKTGLKAISVNLGTMHDVGVLAETDTTGNIKLWEEVLGIREPAFHTLMESLINQQQRRS